MKTASSQLCLIAMSVFLGLSLWFSTSAVGPEIEAAWDLTSGQVAWLTMAVQLGFVVGTLLSALLNLPDRIPAQWLIAGSAALGGLVNLVIAVGVSDAWGSTAAGFNAVLACRLAIGMTMAGIYPPGMKLVASWFSQRRGLAIGVVVGALTVGSASPHLLLALPLGSWLQVAEGGLPLWRLELLVVSAAAGVSALIAVCGIRPGPLLPRTTQFDWRYFYRMWQNEPLRRANFGYLGHQWELYAMWTWVPLLVAGSFAEADWDPVWGRTASFIVVGIGGVGCVAAGLFSDRFGRTRTTMVCLAVSGSCCLVAGWLEAYPVALTVLCLVWGLTVVADSAQFSTAVSELSQPDLVGTALTVQTCIGFLLTVATIRLVPLLQEQYGWPLALSILALGPVFGIWHMARLRKHPEAARMAAGQR